MRPRRRTTGAATVAVLAAGLFLATSTTPAYATYSLTSTRATYRDTGTCPCSLSDPFDGTYFEYDAGGMAAKVEVWDGAGSYISKVEFHPLDEKLWIYDTKNDGDGIYAYVWYYDSSGTYHTAGPWAPAGTSNVVDYKVINLDIPEGTSVHVGLLDDPWGSDIVDVVATA